MWREAEVRTIVGEALRHGSMISVLGVEWSHLNLRIQLIQGETAAWGRALG